MAGVHHGVGRKGEQLGANALDDCRVAAEASSGRSRPPAKQRVTTEDDALRRGMQTATAGRVAGRMKNTDVDPGDLQRSSRHQRAVRTSIGVHNVPQHPIVSVQINWRIHFIGQCAGGVDVIVVTVSEHDGAHVTAVDSRHNRLVVVRRINNDDVAIVAHQPDVVGDFPLSTVESKNSLCCNEFHRHNNPAVRSLVRVLRVLLEYNDGTKNLATLHTVKGRFDILERNGFRHELVQVEASLQVQIDE